MAASDALGRTVEQEVFISIHEKPFKEDLDQASSVIVGSSSPWSRLEHNIGKRDQQYISGTRNLETRVGQSPSKSDQNIPSLPSTEGRVGEIFSYGMFRHARVLADF